MKPNDVVIVGAKRTPVGALLGRLSTFSAPELGAFASIAALQQAGLSPNAIDEVIFGCVLSAGLGQAPARQMAFKTGLSESTPALTINKMCGSGLKACMLGDNLIRLGHATTVLCGGMESMSQAPYLLPKARQGYRLGHQHCMDHMYLDGLEDAYEPGRLMGSFADDTAKARAFTRAAQDAFATHSMQRALNAIQQGFFLDEIAPITIQHKKETTLMTIDECPDEKKLAKTATLKPVFSPDGTVTAGNSSAIADGAASLILMNAQAATEQGIQPLARIVSQSTFATTPAHFTTAPAPAIRLALQRAGWTENDVDLYEINEAFAVVALAAIDTLKLDEAKVNIHGGACALGHPIGASGARILVSLLYALQHTQKKRGIASLCIGGGEAVAVAIERL